MSDTWNAAPEFTSDMLPKPAPVRPTWDSAPPLEGPTPRAKAVVQANDNSEEAAQAIKVGKQLNLPAPLVQSDVPGYTASAKEQSARTAVDQPALAKYVDKNPMAASVSADDWEYLQYTSMPSWEGLKQTGVNGVAQLKALGKSLSAIDMAGERGFKKGFGEDETPTGVSDDFIAAMQKAGIYHTPGMPYQGLQALNEATITPTAAIINKGLRTLTGAAYAVAETVGQTVREFGAPPSLVSGDTLYEGDKYYFSLPRLENDLGNREVAGERAEREMLNLATYGMTHNPISPRVGELSAPVKYLTTEQFLQRVQALTDREAIDAFLRGKEADKGPLLMITKAEHASEVLDHAVEVAQESKTKTRSPELYASAAAEVTDDVVHIPASKIIELYGKANKVPAEGDGLFGFVPDLAKKLDIAAAAGGEVTIPAAQYIAHVDPTVHEGLKEDVRLHDDGVTLTEAKELEEDFKAQNLEQIAQAAVQVDGKFYQGVLHPDALELAAKDQGTTVEALQDRLASGDPGIIEGFYTTKNRFVDRAEAVDVANKADQIERGKPLVEGSLSSEDLKPTEIDYTKDYSPSAETTKGKPGANTSRLANLLSQNLYGDERNMSTVSVKEMVQNAFDAIKGHLEKGKIKEGKINVQLDRQERTITISDNGSGMTPEVLGKQFLEIAGTSKETEAASGGLGIAKMQFLFGNKELHVITLRDGKVSEMITSGAQLRKALAGDESAAPDINTRIMSRKDRELFPDGHGTIVKVTVPESYKDASSGDMKPIAFDTWRGSHPVVTNSPLFNNIELTFNGNVLPVGKNFPAKDFTQFANVNFDWGTARVYVTKAPNASKEWGDNLHVLSNGLWQFSLELKKDPNRSYGENIQHQFYVDVSPNVAPDAPGYPFELSRQGFSPKTRKDFGKIFQYIQRAYQQLDFANSAKNFGDIQYLDIGDTGVQFSEKQKLQPEEASKAVDEAALKEGDQVEVIDGKLIVGGREIPELSAEDLGKNVLDVDKMRIDQSLIDPNRVMLHDNIEVRIKEGPAEAPIGEEVIPLGDNWVSLVDAAREKFPERFDEFMFGVGDAFMRLRNEVADALGYPELRQEGIGLSFDPEYRGVSIRLPFSASFLNPAVPVFLDPIRAAVGVIGTAIHELAHHKVRSHDAEFPAEMQKIQIFLDTNEILMQAGREGGEGFKLSELKQEMVELYEQYHDVFLWLNKQITEGASDTVRTRGKRFKDSGEVTTGDGSAAPDVGAGGDGGLGPSYQSIKGGEGDATTPGGPQSPGNVIGATKEAAELEKKQLYLSPLFKDAKAVGITAGEFGRYSKKLEKADNDILDRAIKLYKGRIKQSLSAEYKRDEAAARDRITQELRDSGPFAAEKFLRENKINLSAENADAFAGVFGFDGAADLEAHLGAIEAAKRGGVSLDKQFKDTVDALVKDEMDRKHGDLATKIADEAREIATDGHTFDVLDFEIRTLAKAGRLPLPIDKAALVAQGRAMFEASLVSDGANYASHRRAVERGGREAEKALLKGDFQEAFQAKQRQFLAAVMMRESNRLQRTIDSVEKKIDKFTSNQVVPSIDQQHLEQIRGLLESVGVPQQFPPTTEQVQLSQFVADSEGQLAVADFLLSKPPKIENMTVEQFRDFQKSLRSMEHVGALAKQLHSAMGAAELQNVIFDIGKELARFPSLDQPNLPSIGQRARGLWRQVIGSHLLVERMLDYTDAFNPDGPLTRYLDRPLRNANVRELELTERLTKDLRELKGLGDSSLSELVENNLFKDQLDKSGFLKMNRQNVRIVALNMGNRSNIAKVTEGFNVDEKDVRRWLDKNMRPQDWDWVQGMWDIFKWLKEEADAMQLRDTGVPADTLEPVEINGRTGGYAPVVYDRDRSNIAGHIASKNPIFAPTYYTATTPQGYTVKRTAFAAPLDLNGTYLPSKMQAMVHDIAFREAVRNASKLVNNAEFNAMIAQKWSVEFKDLLHGWLKDIANSHLIDDAYAKDWARWISILRHNVTSTLIAMNPGTFIKHGFTAMGMSIERVGAGGIAKAGFEIGPTGFVKFIPDLFKPNDIVPNQAFMDAYRDTIDQGERGDRAREFILQSSAVMRNRQKTYQDTIRGAYEEGTRFGVKKGFTDFRQMSMTVGRVPVALSDALSAMPTWLAAYRTAYSAGKSHEDSVFIADKEVSRAHGSSFIGDRPRVSRLPNSVGGEVLKSFVALYNFWNHSFNNQIQLIWDMAAKARETQQPLEGLPSPQIMDLVKFEDGQWWYRPEPNATWSSFSKRLALIMATIFIEEMATAPLDDDGHGWLAKAALAFIRYAGSGIVGLREITNGFAHGYEPSVGMLGTMARAMTQAGRDIKNSASTGKRVSKDWMTHAATALGFATGIGGSQYGRTATGITGMVTGRDVPKNLNTLGGFNRLRQQLRTGHSQPRKH